MITDKTISDKRKIIRMLYYDKTLSITEISNKLNKSLPVITKLLSDLMREKFVTETGFAPSTGGRKPVMYALSSNVIYIVSVAMDQFVTRIAIMNMRNEFVTPVQKFELPLLNNEGALTSLVENINCVINKSGISKNKFAGVGIGMPGFVDIKKSINYTYLPTGEDGLTDYIGARIKLPVFIDNDSSLIALAELQFGAARNRKNAMVVNAGWGVGLGMILNGELYRGHNGFAGEFSHIPLFFNGKLCFCGKSGCLETEASLRVVVEKALEGLKAGQASKLTEAALDNAESAYEAIMKAVKAGDRFIIGLLSEAGFKIGRGVAILIHLFNPEVVILSGRGASAGQVWVAPLQHALNEFCIPSLVANTSLEISALAYNSELIGAAALVMENYEKKTESKSRLKKPKVLVE